MNRRSSPPKNNWLIYVIAFAAIYFLLVKPFMALKAADSREITSEQLIVMAQKNEIAEVIFYSGTNDVTVKLKAVSPKEPPQYRYVKAVNGVHLEEVRQMVRTSKIPYNVVNPPDSGGILNGLGGLFNIVLPLVMIWFVFNMMRGQAGAMGQFGKNKAKRFDPVAGKKTFADIAGCEEAKEELTEVVEFLKDSSKFIQVGARIPKGILLVGEPGTGKTAMARAVAGEANVPFFSISGSDFVEMFVGVGASRVRDLFETARKNAPCIIFIDEIDAVGGERGGSRSRSHDEREQTLNAMLVEMDGFDSRTGVVVMAATNRKDILDKALLRPGRFDRQVEVPMPDLNAREAILKIYLKNIPIGADVDSRSIAHDTTGMSGADLESVVNEAALLAVRRNLKFVNQSELSDAVDRVGMGKERKSMVLRESEKRTVAYHEAGHALICTLWPGAESVHKITIVPRGGALGFVRPMKEDRYLPTQEEIWAEVAVCCGGRAAEELFIKTITPGASSDFARATSILQKMVCLWSMGESGLMVYGQKIDPWTGSVAMDVSENTKQQLEAEVKGTLNKIYGQVKAMLEENREKLERLAQALLVKETLDANEVLAILKPAS